MLEPTNENSVVRLLVTSARQNNTLTICHALFDKNLLTVFFLDFFCAFALFTSVKPSDIMCIRQIVTRTSPSPSASRRDPRIQSTSPLMFLSDLVQPKILQRVRKVSVVITNLSLNVGPAFAFTLYARFWFGVSPCPRPVVSCHTCSHRKMTINPPFAYTTRHILLH